jgi:uncharacterized protein YjaG (DUF416 family)
MMMPAYKSEVLKERLNQLDEKKQLVFGALCCERLLPNYVAFQQDTNSGNIMVVRQSLDIIWKFISNENISKKDLETQIASCEAAAPNSSEFDSLYVTVAQDACFAVCCLLDCLMNMEVDKIAQTATYATDSVDLYVQEIENMKPDDPYLENKILSHPLMQRELLQQEEDLKSIESIESLTEQFLDLRRNSWKNNRKSNLNLPD